LHRVLLNKTVVFSLLIISLLTGQSIAKESLDLSAGKAVPFNQIAAQDSVRRDTLAPLPFPFKDKNIFVNPSSSDTSALYLKKPSNIQTVIEYDPISGDYLISEKIGTMDYRLPSSMSRQDFLKNDLR